jgi:uracil-DNA glycosylase family 4
MSDAFQLKAQPIKHKIQGEGIYGCENCFFRSPRIGDKGPLDAPIVFVGEGPGIMEIAKNKPFVGPSGELIDKVIEKAGGLPPGMQALWTNATSCLPRKVEDTKEQQQRLSAACVQCRPRLLRTIEAYPRKLIIAMGNAALWSLTGDFSLKITQERGKFFPSPLAELGIFAVVHPAFLLRGNGNSIQFENDIAYALEVAEKGEQARRLPNGTKYYVLDTADEVLDFAATLRAMHKDDYTARDYETTGFSFIDDEVLCLGIQHKPTESVIIPRHLHIPELFSGKVKQVWHNGKFDIRFARGKMNSPLARVDHDTMLMSYCLNERRGIHDLDSVAFDHLGSPNHKGMLKEWTKGTIIDPITGIKRKRNYGDVPDEVLWRYLALDLSDTYHLVPVLLPRVEADANLRKFYYQHCIAASEYLAKVEMNGFAVDFDQVNKNDVRLKEIEDKHELAINQISIDLTGQTVNPRSPKQLSTILFGELKLAPEGTGTDKSTLKTLVETNPHPILMELLNYRKAQKGRSTYTTNLLGKPDKKTGIRSLERDVHSDGKVHQSYLIHGTPTSRLACNDPNLQNIPRDYLLRGQYVPEFGYGILEVDYSQAELRCLAALSGCPDLGGIFLAGKDLHVEFSTYLFGEGFTKEEKMAAKTVNFGIPYGRTAISMVLDPDLNTKMDVTLARAQGWIDSWGERFPRAWAFIEECRRAPIDNLTMLTVFGNKKRPGVVSQENLNEAQNQSANFPHQSTASNLTIRAGVELIDPLERDYDTRIRNTVHDCIVTTVPLHVPTIKTVAGIMVAKMEEIATRYPYLKKIPFKAEPEFGLRWGNLMKFKELDAIDWDLSRIPQFIEPH